MIKTLVPAIETLQMILLRERNKITDYIITPDKKGAAEKLKLVNPAVRQEAKDIKQMLKESNMLVGNLFGNSPIKSFKTLAGLKMNDADNFLNKD